MERRDRTASKADELQNLGSEDDDAGMAHGLESCAPILCYRLFFAVLPSNDIPKPRKEKKIRIVCIDDELVYQNFCNDFGPLNISMLYQYCTKLNAMLKEEALEGHIIIHCTRPETSKILNSAFLIGSYAIIYLNYTVKSILQTLKPTLNRVEGVNFCDASQRDPYFLSLGECLSGIAKAHRRAFFNFQDFDVAHYQYYERVENGDMNWIVPGKFLAFCGPQTEPRGDYTTSSVHSPDDYVGYFKDNNIGTVVRLNLKRYNAKAFTDHGIKHYELFFVDGGTPSDFILKRFLEICEEEKGAIAVHCRAGLGRTGTLIGAYLMKHYGFAALEAVAWLRICRPGSVIGQQQTWLQGKQQWLTAEAKVFRRLHPHFIPKCHKYGIYSMIKERPLENSKRVAESEEGGDKEIAKKSHCVVNENAANIERVTSLGQRQRSKSMQVDNRFAPSTINQHGITYNTRTRNTLTGSLTRDDKLAGASRYRKSTGAVLEPSSGNVQKTQEEKATKPCIVEKSIDKTELGQQRMPTTLEPSYPPTNHALDIGLQTTKPNENIIAVAATQPSPPISSHPLQALKKSPPMEPHLTMNSQTPIHTTPPELKIDASNEIQQSPCPVSSDPLMALKRSSSLETLQCNDNGDRIGNAATLYESFGEDSIDDSIDILIPVVDVHYLGKIQTERPRRIKKLAALSCIAKRLRTKSQCSPPSLGQRPVSSIIGFREKEVAVVRVPRRRPTKDIVDDTNANRSRSKIPSAQGMTSNIVPPSATSAIPLRKPRRRQTTVVVTEQSRGNGGRMRSQSIAVVDNAEPSLRISDDGSTANQLRSKTSDPSSQGMPSKNMATPCEKEVVRKPQHQHSTIADQKGSVTMANELIADRNISLKSVKQSSTTDNVRGKCNDKPTILKTTHRKPMMPLVETSLEFINVGNTANDEIDIQPVAESTTPSEKLLSNTLQSDSNVNSEYHTVDHPELTPVVPDFNKNFEEITTAGKCVEDTVESSTGV